MLKSAMVVMSAWGAGSLQRARMGSSTAPPGTRFGGRAALRSRLLGAVLGTGGRGADDLPVAELVLDELADRVVLRERLGERLRVLGERDGHAFVDVARG